MLSFPSPLSPFFARAVFAFIISSLIVFIYLPSDNSFTPAIFQHCLAFEVISSSSPLLIAKADGTIPAYNVTDYAHGVGSESDNNYILSCGAAQKMLGPGDFYLTVNAGELYDYIIPYDPYTKKGRSIAASLCDTLYRYNNITLVSYYLYSGIKPDTLEFNGNAKIVFKWAGSTTPYLGGCNVYVSDDDRYTITRWGLYQKDYSKKGSCCFNTTKQAHTPLLWGTWGKPFEITAHKFNGSFVYISKAAAGYNANNVAVNGKVNDLYLSSWGMTCSWNITITFVDKALPSVSYLSKGCKLGANIPVTSKPSKATFTCTVSDTSKTFWPSTTDQSKTVTVQI